MCYVFNQVWRPYQIRGCGKFPCKGFRTIMNDSTLSPCSHHTTTSLLQKTKCKNSWNIHQKAAQWTTLPFVFLFISWKAEKLMKTGYANLYSNAVIDRAAQRIGEDRCSETPTFVIGFSMSQHDRHLVAHQLLLHLVRRSHSWGEEGSIGQVWLFLGRKRT